MDKYEPAIVAMALALVAVILVIAAVVFRISSKTTQLFLQQLRNEGKVAYIWVPPMYEGWKLFIISIDPSGTLVLWHRHKGVFSPMMTLGRGEYRLEKARIQVAPIRRNDGITIVAAAFGTAPIMLVLHKDMPSAFVFLNKSSFDIAWTALERAANAH